MNESVKANPPMHLETALSSLTLKPQEEHIKSLVEEDIEKDSSCLKEEFKIEAEATPSNNGEDLSNLNIKEQDATNKEDEEDIFSKLSPKNESIMVATPSNINIEDVLASLNQQDQEEKVICKQDVNIEPESKLKESFTKIEEIVLALIEKIDVHDGKDQEENELHFPPELYDEIAIYLPIQDVLKMQMMSKNIRKVMKKVPVLTIMNFDAAIDCWLSEKGPPSTGGHLKFSVLLSDARKSPFIYLAIVQKFLDHDKPRAMRNEISVTLEDLEHQMCNVMLPFLEMIGGNEFLCSMVSKVFNQGKSKDGYYSGYLLLDLPIVALAGCSEALSHFYPTQTLLESLRSLSTISEYCIYSKSLEVVKVPLRCEEHSFSCRLSKVIGSFATVEIMEEILKRNSRGFRLVLYNFWDMVEAAAEAGNSDVFKLLLNQLSWRSLNLSKLVKSSKDGSIKCLQIYLDSGILIFSSEFAEAFHVARKENNLMALDLLTMAVRNNRFSRFC